MIKSGALSKVNLFLVIIAFLCFAFISCQKETKLNTDFYFQKIYEYKSVNTDSMVIYIAKLDLIYNQLNLEQKSRLLAFKGYYNSSKSKNYLAKNYCEKALEIALQLNNDSLLAYAYNGLGITYKNQNEFDLAVKNYLKALTYFEKLKNYHGLSNVNVNLANMYQEKEDVELANTYLKKTMEALQLSASIPVYLSVLHIKANLFGMAGQLDSALAIDKYALKLIDSLHVPKQKTEFLNNMALCMLYSNQNEKAEKYFLESIKIDSLNGDVRLVTDSYISLSQLKMQTNNPEEALRYNQLALSLAKSIKNPMFMASAYKNASTILSQKGDYLNALKYKDSVILLTKQITNDKKEKVQIELTELYESEKKDNLLIEKSSQLSQLKLIFFFIFSIVLLAGVFGYNYFKNYKKISSLKLEKTIEETNQNERIRISRDLHDNMGSYATSLLSQIDSLELLAGIKDNPKIKELRGDAENIMSTLRETIWILKTKTISIKQFFELLKLYAEKNLSHKMGIQLTFNELVVKEVELSPTESLNLYRIMQEIIQNIMKHAQAKNVQIELSSTEKISIIVTDDGKGFETNNQDRKSGLENMQFRANEINYQIEIKSSTDEGTQVRVREKL
jgi:signal transduction histidine kinase